MEGYITDQEIHQDLLEKIYNNKEFDDLGKKVNNLMNKLDTMKEDMVIENKGNVTKEDVLEGKTFLNKDNKLESGSIKTIEKTFDINLESKTIDKAHYKNSKIKGLNDYSEDSVINMINGYINNNGNYRKDFTEKIVKDNISNIKDNLSDIMKDIDYPIIIKKELNFKKIRHEKKFIIDFESDFKMYMSSIKCIATKDSISIGYFDNPITTVFNNGNHIALNSSAKKPIFNAPGGGFDSSKSVSLELKKTNKNSLEFELDCNSECDISIECTLIGIK